MDRISVSTIVMVLVLIFLIGPFVVIFISSFGTQEFLSFPPQGFTLGWFKKVISMDMFKESMKLSVIIAILASIFASILGIPSAYALSRYNFMGKRIVETFLTLPVIVPGMVAGLTLLRIFVMMNLFSIKTTLLIGHTIIVLPYSIRITRTALENLPTDIEEAAISLGASKLKAFFLTVLPNIKTGIVASFILMFIISFNNVPISLFLTGPGVNMLPIVMMSYMEYYYDPSIAALSTLLILLTFGIVILSQKLLGITRYM